MKNKGFTLIELLAVIVILAIIALIAAPIVLNIISDTKESANLRSAEFYLDAVETAVAQSKLNGVNIGEEPYPVMVDGNICIGTLSGENCNGTKLLVQINGEVPAAGSTVKIINGEVEEVELKYGTNTIVKEDGNLKFADKKDSEDEFVNEYELGEYVKFNPGDVERTWNVIDEDETTVTLLLSENLIDNVKWNEDDSFDYGPTTALDVLNKFTSDNNWSDQLTISNYTYINTDRVNDSVSGYQKLEIQNGIAKLTSKDGETITQINGTTKARILSVSEVLEISGRINPNLSADSLDTFLNENVEELKTLTGSSFNSAKEISEENWGLYNHELAFLYAMNLVSEIESLSSYDLSFPSWILTTDDGYWTLTSLYYEGNSAWFVAPGYVVPYYVDYAGNGIRPVITIKKEGSNIIKL